MHHFYGPPRRTAPSDRGPEAARDGRRRPQSPKLVINCLRLGKDRVKNFVIDFTSRPPTADERPVIPFVNLTGRPDRGCGTATGSCTARGTKPRVSSVAVESSGAL